jgi:DNA-binding MarR family transcriptional regulator
MNDSHNEVNGNGDYSEKSEDYDEGNARGATATGVVAVAGTHAALSFGRKIKGFGISPPHVGILRWIRDNSGENQRQLASHRGVLPSRLVLLLDELETKGLVTRQRSAQDRRNQELLLSKKGTRLLEKVETIATAHEADLSSALTETERETLIDLCAKLAAHRGVGPRGHPGYMKRAAARGTTRQAKP